MLMKSEELKCFTVYEYLNLYDLLGQSGFTVARSGIDDGRGDGVGNMCEAV